MTGYATFITRGTQIHVKGKGSVQPGLAALLGRGNGYRLGREPNVTPERWREKHAENRTARAE